MELIDDDSVPTQYLLTGFGHGSQTVVRLFREFPRAWLQRTHGFKPLSEQLVNRLG